MGPEDRDSYDVGGTADDPETIALFVLGSCDPSDRSRLRLRTVATLVRRPLDPDGGPFPIDEAIDGLVVKGLVDSETMLLTPSGTDAFGRIDPLFVASFGDAAGFWINFTSGLTDDELLTFAGSCVPGLAGDGGSARSPDEVLRDTVSLVRKGKVTASRGAEILGMNLSISRTSSGPRASDGGPERFIAGDVHCTRPWTLAPGRNCLRGNVQGFQTDLRFY